MIYELPKLFADEMMILNFLEESISIVNGSWNQNLLTHVGWWCFILLDMKALFDAFVTFVKNIKMSGFLLNAIFWKMSVWYLQYYIILTKSYINLLHFISEYICYKISDYLN